MADITITIDDAYMGEFNSIIPIICAAENYKSTVPDPFNLGKTIPNPVTPQMFVMGIIYNFLADIKTAYLARTASDKARTQAIADSQAQAIPGDKITVKIPVASPT